ncbi:MAG TPA: hypothetical protein VH498_03145 [Candidatus Dormibacteraeota bacterium]|nr:hypothetical protein [Candidatus Dormibacteraeota bacterium]
MDELRDLARAVLLAFADLGVFLPSNRERLIRKMRFLDPLNADELAEFLNLCLDAGLITHADAGRVRLDRSEARRLASSMDGHTPVPDDQASAWAVRLGGPSLA